MSSDQTSFPITPADRIRRRQSSQQLLFDGRSPDGVSNAVVVYDYDQQALVAHTGASPTGRQQLQSPPRGRCPVCSSPLDPNGPSPAYFSSLQYWHNKLALPGHGSNPFSAPTAEDAVNDLRNLSSGLLVNGYYGRFFAETERLGTGSFGSVYRCNHVIDGVVLGQFAVKKIPVGDSREWLRGIMREVKALERLASHPNIVAYKHSWLEMSRANELCPYVPYLFILMSYCDGGSLEEFVFQTPPKIVPDQSVWSLFIDITNGLQHLHRNFVIHRDLKPSNVLLTRDRDIVRAVLSDFGTAELEGSANHSGFSGTVEYTAPEVLDPNGSHEYSDRSDMWSLGIVLYAMCYGHVPWSDPDPLRCARMVTSTTQLQLPASPPRDTDLQQIIQALTARDAHLRPSCDDILFHPYIRAKVDDIRR
jgi:serine/threonine protein kinase